SQAVLPAIVLRGTHEYVPVAPRRVLRRKAPQANSGQHSRSVDRVPHRANPGMPAFSRVSTTARGSRCAGLPARYPEQGWFCDTIFSLTSASSNAAPISGKTCT
nr:hypothetical protein [Pseudomonadales bacterium]